jgi:hypothetical protein
MASDQKHQPPDQLQAGPQALAAQPYAPVNDTGGTAAGGDIDGVQRTDQVSWQALSLAHYLMPLGTQGLHLTLNMIPVEIE